MISFTALPASEFACLCFRARAVLQVSKVTMV